MHADPDLEELVPGYLKNRSDDVNSIRDLLVGDNLQEILKIGHSMKGSGGGYGFDGITRIGGDIEKAARKGDKDAIEKLNTKLADYLALVRVVFSNCK